MNEQARIDQLEVKVAFLEDSLITLSDEHFVQQKELETIRAKLSLLAEKLRNTSDDSQSNTEVLDEKPPHY